MEEGILEFSIEIKPLGSISPTRFVSLRQCALRELLAASGAPELLPGYPAARLGSAIHELLREAAERHFVSGGLASVRRRWRALVDASEEAMRSTWLERHLVPLEKSLPDFEVRRIQAEHRALEITSAVQHTGHKEHREDGFGFELPVATPDGLVQGRVDAAIPGDKGPIIRDYKSGAIFEPRLMDRLLLKDAYQVQLRIYAALYAASFARWPARLEIVPLFGSGALVSFDKDLCMDLLEQARIALKRVNAIIAEAGNRGEQLQEMLASPGPATCFHCPYRPICGPYHAAVTANGRAWPRDLWGQMDEIRQLSNSRLVILVRTEGGLARIRDVSPNPSRHPALRQLRRGDQVAVFSLKSGGSTTAEESQFTVFYKLLI